MAWIAITEAHIKTKLSSVELAAFRTAATVSGETDPVASIIAQHINDARGYIANCQRNQLGPDGTIPDKLLNDVLSLIVLDIMSRPGGQVIDPEDVRRTNARNAIQKLRDVAQCRYAIEAPETVSSEVINDFTPSFSGRDRAYRDQDGI